ncbi:hypothetical protein AVEN_168612-1 [Araneus ventricosus]|uniref:Endonuclease/exonuclease/phosphatase domain-containing protein n=1 Tax=Araneus ventricosus TaxID=182803 RepID=A0A4Y2SIB0_ARAVE|nr:hypothetical protein AVEN_168612-1 [Araneus ventricosus]
MNTLTVILSFLFIPRMTTCPPATWKIHHQLLQTLSPGFPFFLFFPLGFLFSLCVSLLMASLVSWNCRGLQTKISDLKDIINTYRPACIALQETHFKTTDNIKGKHYSVLNKNYDSDRASGGVALLIAKDIPSAPLQINTSLQAIAARIHTISLITICSLYLPPNQQINQIDLNELVYQLPDPFILLDDFNGHSSIWGSSDSNSRGVQIEQLLTDHNLCILNSDQQTYFHQPTKTFHSIDLAICSPSIYPFFDLAIDNSLHNSDHFPLTLSDNRNNHFDSNRPERYVFAAANWTKFARLAAITTHMVENSSIDEAVYAVTRVMNDAANSAIPKAHNSGRKQNKPWWNQDCRMALNRQDKAWSIFRRYPTTSNLIAFKMARAEFRRIRRRSERASWINYISTITYSTSSYKLWQKVKRASGASI